MEEQRSSAPGRLEVLRRFVNTLDIEEGTDLLRDRAECGSWLASHGLLGSGEELTPADVRRVHAVREAMRQALAAHYSGDALPEAALETLNDTIRRAGLSVSLNEEGWALTVDAGGGWGGLGQLAVIMLEAMTRGTWERLKVCANSGCQWAFYDHSRARSGKWCSMSACGNRAKQRAWRERQS